MKRILIICTIMSMVFSLTLTIIVSASDAVDAKIDLSTYGTDFDWKTLLRRPEKHIGEKYLISGRLVDPGKLGSDGYKEAWIELDEYTKNDEYMGLRIDPLDFKLLENDWLDVYVTITNFGLLSGYSKEVFYASVEALTVYDGKGGEVLETYVKTGGEIPGQNSGNKYPEEYSSEFDYEEIYRNPEKYKGTKYYVQGTVVQVLGDKEKGFNLRVALNGDSSQIFLVVGSSDLNFLEDDNVSIYGTFGGNYTYSSFATSITIPRIDGTIQLDKK